MTLHTAIYKSYINNLEDREIAVSTPSKRFQGAFSMHYLDAQIPFYVYKVTCLETQEYYWGSRTANRKRRLMPSQDLWIKYYSSSKLLKQLIQVYGKERFKAEIIQEMWDADEAFWLEQEFIKSSINDPKCLNKYYIDRATSKKAFSSYNRCGERHHFYGVPKEKTPWFGKKRSDEEKAKISANHAPCAGSLNSRALKWEIIGPSGEVIKAHGDVEQVVKNLGLSIVLLKKYINQSVPSRSTMCRSNISRATVGWQLTKVT
jgi:hypothetical protein